MLTFNILQYYNSAKGVKMLKRLEDIQDKVYEIQSFFSVLDNALEYCSDNDIHDVSHLIKQSKLIAKHIDELDSFVDDYYYKFMSYRFRIKRKFINNK